jgi:DNA topoisomerase-1
MKNLVIVESPSKSKTIEKYLGPDYKVVSSKGHIRDLAIKGKDGLGVDVENNFEPTYSINKDKKDVVKDLKKWAKEVDYIYLATDPDREGEAISWHLAQILDLDVNDTNRVVFNEVTKKAVISAFEQPRTIDAGLVKSQETRRILDRIIGFKLSKLLKSKIRSKSAGRVQSVSLKMICLKEADINAFIPEEYWNLNATFEKDGLEFDAGLAKVDGKKIKITNAEQALDIFNRSNDTFTVTNIKKQVKQRKSKLPFITSTLQQEGSSRLNFSARKTMSVAQKLYEGIQLKDDTQGLITYMRTDSTRLSSVFIDDARNYIESNFGKEYLGIYKVKNDEKSQDAHEAIRPTSIDNKPEDIQQYLTNDEYKLYKFIYYRAISSLMSPVKNNTISYTLSVNDVDYTSNGTTMIFDGFLKVYKDYDNSKDVILPVLIEEEKINTKDLVKEQHFTEPPSRYTESKLIKAMEEEGIGRPSTYATIIDTIQARGYVDLKKATETGKTKYFYPTEQGLLTDSKLTEFFNEIINVKYTANMENELDLIADEKLDSVKALQTFYDIFQPLLENAYENMEKKELEKTGDLCPECEGELVYRQGRFGKFISCINFPTCKYTARIVDPNKFVPEKSGKMCPECGNELLKRKSRYGKFFFGCSNYPECKHIENLDAEGNVISVVNSADVKTKKKTTTKKKPAAKKAAVKKPTAKKAATKTTTTKKTAVKKTSTKKTTAKKPAVKKPAVKKAAGKKVVVKEETTNE